MQRIRRSAERGYADHGWLRSFHSFSFADYFDPAHVGFGPLRVINEDRVRGGGGFARHAHRDMEILSYVLDGELAHSDSMGNGSTIRRGDVQRMSAGRGVQHAEYNASPTKDVHFLQIWLHPESNGIDPGYEQKHFDDDAKRGRLALIASRGGDDGSVIVHQDTRVYAGLFDGDETATLAPPPGRKLYVHVARGAIEANGAHLDAGDALMDDTPGKLELRRGRGAEVLVFDLPATI